MYCRLAKTCEGCRRGIIEAPDTDTTHECRWDYSLRCGVDFCHCIGIRDRNEGYFNIFYIYEASSKSSSQSRKRTGEPVSGSEFSDEDEEEDDVPLAVYGGKSSSKKSKVCPESQSTTYLLGTVGTVPMPKGLHYFFPESVRKDILDNKLVHLHKLVPGYDAAFSGSQSLVSETDSSGVSRISLGSKTAEERRLARQKLDFGQMIIALQKYKAIVAKVSPERAVNIDCYISNITHIFNNFQGTNAYWGYHLLFWENAIDQAREDIAVDWRNLDSVSLQAAISHAPRPSSCAKCCIFSHTTANCPFTTRKEVDGFELPTSASTSEKRHNIGESLQDFCVF